MQTSCKFSGGRRLTNVIKEQAWKVAVGSIYLDEVMHGAAGSGPGGQHPWMPVSGLAIIGSEMLIRMFDEAFDVRHHIGIYYRAMSTAA